MSKYIKTCTFIGHRKINITAELKNRLFTLLEFLIVKEGVGRFLLGSASQFNDLCREVLLTIKQKFTHIQRVYVRVEYHLEDNQGFISRYYDSSYFPECAIGAGKKLYVVRNQYMIDKSDFVVLYFDNNYKPTEIFVEKITSRIRKNSGTRIAYEYAKQKRKVIYNLF